MDRALPCEGRDTSSIPVGRISLRRRRSQKRSQFSSFHEIKTKRVRNVTHIKLIITSRLKTVNKFLKKTRWLRWVGI